jgi:hypothetical protein
LLKDAAESEGLFFSTWAREIIFRHLKRKPPRRPKR